MKKEEVLKICRYYKGEKKNPYSPVDIKERFWILESNYCIETYKSKMYGTKQIFELFNSIASKEVLAYLNSFDDNTRIMLAAFGVLSYSHDSMDGVDFLLMYDRTLKRRKKVLLSKCKYYHGEEECPQGKPWDPFERYWSAERNYIVGAFNYPCSHQGKDYASEADYWETDGMDFCLHLFPMLKEFLNKYETDVRGMLACIIVDIVDHSDWEGPDFILNYGELEPREKQKREEVVVVPTKVKSEEFKEFCRYYKGEETNPYEPNTTKWIFWNLEFQYLDIDSEVWIEKARSYHRDYPNKWNFMTSDAPIENKAFVLFANEKLLENKSLKINVFSEYSNFIPDALSICRFYKGEKTCPYLPSDIRSSYWDLEETWIKMVLPNEIKEENMSSAFLISMGGMDTIDIPVSLKATFFEFFCHWNGMKDGFTDYLLQYMAEREKEDRRRSSSKTQHKTSISKNIVNNNSNTIKPMEYGIVYLLTNPVMPGLVKIGMTAQEDIDKRMKELYTTGVPVPFECQFACRVNKSDCLKIEKALHKAFEPQRINANREFFRIQVEQAKAILELFHHTDVTEEVKDEITNELTDDDKEASFKAQVHRPALNFYEMGIQKGAILEWKDDPSITVTVASERKIIYQGEECSISALSAQLKGYKVKHIAPGPCWLYKDKLLSDIYDETYPFDE